MTRMHGPALTSRSTDRKQCRYWYVAIVLKHQVRKLMFSNQPCTPTNQPPINAFLKYQSKKYDYSLSHVNRTSRETKANRVNIHAYKFFSQWMLLVCFILCAEKCYQLAPAGDQLAAKTNIQEAWEREYTLGGLLLDNEERICCFHRTREPLCVDQW